MRILKPSLLLASAVLVTSGAQAGVIKIDETAFNPGSGKITFSEFSMGTENPTYNPSDYGGDSNSPVVNFDGYFEGQSLGNAGDCPAGAALSGCVVGSPTGPLALDAASPDTYIANDGAHPDTPVLSGSPRFNGPISVLFDKDLAGVGLAGGHFNAVGGTAITAFDRSGDILGQVTNEEIGIEFLGLVTENNVNSIAGLQFSLVGSEPAGFTIDDMRFGFGDQITPPTPVPEPGAFLLFGLGLMGLGLRRKMKA